MAFLSMLAAWLLSIAVCLAVGLKMLLTLWIGAFALFTFFFFAVPLTAGVAARWQLRLWYLLITASVAWGVLLLALFFHESPLRLFAEPWPGSIFGPWVVGYAAVSSSMYLTLLQFDLRKGASRRSTDSMPVPTP
jgi:hypothetical protein